jgi:molybdopterin converting factor small subunit
MRVRVLLFAAARQAVGNDSIEIEVPQPATIGQLRAALIATLPDLALVLDRAVFSVDAEYAGDATKIVPDAEIACIPPVSGG